MKTRARRMLAVILGTGAAITACAVMPGSAQAAVAPQNQGLNSYAVDNTSGLPFKLVKVEQKLDNGWGSNHLRDLSGVKGESQSFEIESWFGHGDWTEITYQNGSTTVTLVADQYRDFAWDKSRCEISGPNEHGIRCGAAGVGGGRAYLTRLWIDGPAPS